VLCEVLLVGCFSTGSWRIDIPQEEFPFSFTQPPYIHPKIIQDLTTRLSDDGDQVVAINLLNAQGSNRYFGDVHVKEMTRDHPLVYVEGDKEQFGYQYVGKTKGGVHVLYTSNWGGGSGVFKSLMFVVFEYDRGTFSHADRPLIDLTRKRLLIKKLGETALSDRYDGRLKVVGDQLLIGKDTGWFSVSGGSGGGGHTEDVLLRLDFKR
jgi:hypothetical protein